MYVALKALVRNSTKWFTVQLSASMPYLLQDNQNQMHLLILSKAKAQTLFPSEFVCIHQEGFNGEYIEYDDLG